MNRFFISTFRSIFSRAISTIILLLIISTNTSQADQKFELSSQTQYLEQQWAEVTYQSQGKTQIKAFKHLVAEAEQVILKYPDSAIPWIWSGIIKSTYADIKGGLGALKLAKSSKKDFEKALAIDPNAMHGAAYVSLGALYLNVPSWPLGFGNDTKAKELLEKGLSIDPDGIDSNFFYADYLIHEKQYNESKNYLTKAINAPSRPNRTLADAGRQKEIQEKLLFIESKL
jgi:tetratricopeptide (TPR) repeat protein